MDAISEKEVQTPLKLISYAEVPIWQLNIKRLITGTENISMLDSCKRHIFTSPLPAICHHASYKVFGQHIFKNGSFAKSWEKFSYSCHKGFTSTHTNTSEAFECMWSLHMIILWLQVIIIMHQIM